MAVGQQRMLDGYGGPLEHRLTEKVWLGALQGNMLPAEDAEAASHGADRIIWIEARRLIAKPADGCERRLHWLPCSHLFQAEGQAEMAFAEHQLGRSRAALQRAPELGCSLGDLVSQKVHEATKVAA